MTKTIRVTDDTHNKLCKLGKFGDTMNNIITKLLSKQSKPKTQKKKTSN